MSSEKFSNLGESTLDASYTSGGTTLTVVSAAGFPTVGVFRVRIGNAGKTIWRVDSVSGVVFTGAAEANDANAAAADSVKIVASRAVAERWLQSPDSGVIHAPSGVSAVDLYGPIYKTGRPDLVSWTWQNQGAASVIDANGVSFLSLPNTTVNIRSRLISAPGAPYTITAFLRPRFTTATADRQFTGLVFRESGTSKLIIFGIQNGSTIQAIKYTNDTTFSAAIFSTALFTGAALAMGGYWLQIKDDNTNLLFSYSLNGGQFVQVGSEGRTVFMAGAPNQVGIFGDVEASGGAFDVSFLSWLQT